MRNEQELVNEIFDRLDEWRNFPAYLLEGRADIFFGIYLPNIIKKKFGCTVDHIIPEFPIKAGVLFNADPTESAHPLKINFVAVCESVKTVYMISLKTDINSLRPLQYSYLSKARENNIKNIVDGILDIEHASMLKKKYNNLLHKLHAVGWLDQSLKNNTAGQYNIKIVYIQPSSKSGEDEIITFDNIIEYLSEKNDFFTIRFCRSLSSWVNNSPSELQ